MVYYRIIENYLGKKHCFVPEFSYEKVDLVDGKIVEVDYKTLEVCFPKV